MASGFPKVILVVIVVIYLVGPVCFPSSFYLSSTSSFGTHNIWLQDLHLNFLLHGNRKTKQNKTKKHLLLFVLHLPICILLISLLESHSFWLYSLGNLSFCWHKLYLLSLGCFPVHFQVHLIIWDLFHTFK